MRKIAGCACAGNAGNVSPHRRLQRKLLVSDPGMPHGTCVTHVPWCMSGSLTRGGGENVPGACATRNITYLAKGPWNISAEHPMGWKCFLHYTPPLSHATPLWGELVTDCRKGPNGLLWYWALIFSLLLAEQAVEHTVEIPVIWDATRSCYVIVMDVGRVNHVCSIMFDHVQSVETLNCHYRSRRREQLSWN